MLMYEMIPTPTIAGQSRTVAYLTTYLVTLLSVERSSIKPKTWVQPALYEMNPVRCGYSSYLSSGNDLMCGLLKLHLPRGKKPKLPQRAFENDLCAILRTEWNQKKMKWNEKLNSSKLILKINIYYDSINLSIKYKILLLILSL